jgi:uncharacterized membrane protein
MHIQNLLVTNSALWFTASQMENAETYVTRWRGAGLLDESTAAAIRAFELRQIKPRRRQWQVLSALILGGTLLGAGVLLFVAAHWDRVSPISRTFLTLGMLIFFHGFGWLTRERFAGLSTAMHAIGTVSAGAAIALIGQIFNMQEHWPAAVLLWALCAATGWILLRDQFQQTLTLLLVPAWIISEWIYRTSAYAGADVYIARALAVIELFTYPHFFTHKSVWSLESCSVSARCCCRYQSAYWQRRPGIRVTSNSGDSYHSRIVWPLSGLCFWRASSV